MKRYPMFDPPEYVDWKPAPDVMEEFYETLEKDPVRSRILSELSRDQLLDMYAGMLRFRLHDITLSRWVKQGILSKAWLGTGEEAVTIGSVQDRKSTRLNSSHLVISYAVFCLKKKNTPLSTSRYQVSSNNADSIYSIDYYWTRV